MWVCSFVFRFVFLLVYSPLNSSWASSWYCTLLLSTCYLLYLQLYQLCCYFQQKSLTICPSVIAFLFLSFSFIIIGPNHWLLFAYDYYYIALFHCSMNLPCNVVVTVCEHSCVALYPLLYATRHTTPHHVCIIFEVQISHLMRIKRQFFIVNDA